MDKRIIFAVAGSGKTTKLVNSISELKRTAIITYTNANTENLRNKIIKKWGYIPGNITVSSYFSFLYNFCFQPHLNDRLQVCGINFNHPPQFYISPDRRNHYVDGSGRIYSSRLLKSLSHYQLYGALVKRLEKYYDTILVDEVQDIAGRDFDFLEILGRTRLEVLLVGDFHQHTFSTSRDGNYNKSLFDNFNTYRTKLRSFGYKEELNVLSRSYRCSKNLCDFISKKLNIYIQSGRETNTKVSPVCTRGNAAALMKNNSITKLFYSQHYKYMCRSRNWGECKGEDHHNDVCVVLSKNYYEALLSGKTNNMARLTKNKLYVALTRARGDVYLLPEHLISVQPTNSVSFMLCPESIKKASKMASTPNTFYESLLG